MTREKTHASSLFALRRFLLANVIPQRSATAQPPPPPAGEHAVPGGVAMHPVHTPMTVGPTPPPSRPSARERLRTLLGLIRPGSPEAGRPIYVDPTTGRTDGAGSKPWLRARR
ncbi:MAG: hypothetical protein U0835_20395 [Isosphaeraceae bacterium]